MSLFMSAAFATAALPNDPDPTPDRVTGNVPALTRTGRLLGLLHRLIDYGKDLARSLQQRTTAAAPSVVARNFGTMNVALILLRILRGLRLATALQARLIRHPVREEAASSAVPPPSERAPRTAPHWPNRDPARPHPNSPTSPRPKRSPPPCVTARWARSSPTSAAISASFSPARYGAK
jgi:hypothetical protein